MFSLLMMARISSGGAGDPAITPESERGLTPSPPSPGPVDPFCLQLFLGKNIHFSCLILDLFLYLAAGLGLVSCNVWDLPPSHPYFYSDLLAPYIKDWVYTELTPANPGLATLGPILPPHRVETS